MTGRGGGAGRAGRAALGWADVAAARAAAIAPRRVLLVGGAALVLLRLALSLARSGPVIMADEAGYLLNARVLAGGLAPEMGSSPFYRGGYSLLIAPILSLGAGPVATYHLVLACNAALAGLLVVLLHALLTRCFDVAPPVAAWAALAGAAYPSVTALSQVALAETALFVLAAAWLLTATLLLRAGRGRAAPRWAVAAGLCAAASWTVHGRMLVVVILTAVVLAVAARRGARVAAACGLLALAGGMAAGRALNDWLIVRSYGGRAPDEVDHALAPLRELDGLLAVARNLVGQGWYLAAATLGLALLVGAWLAPPALRRLARGRGDHADAALALLLTTALGLLAVSALWLAAPDRPDQLLYGRYVEPVVPLIVAVGLARLGASGRRPGATALVAVLAAWTAVTAVVRAGVDLPVAASRWNVASLPSVTGDLGPPVIALAGVVAGAALCFFVAVARRGAAAPALLALALFAPTTAYAAYLPVLRSERDIYPPGWTSPRTVVERSGATVVGYDLDRFDHIRVKTYQWALPRTRIVLFHGDREAPPSELFFSGRAPGAAVAAGRPTALWRDAGADQVLWRGAGRPAAQGSRGVASASASPRRP